MKSKDIEKLRRLTRFEDLVAYLRDELDWPIEVEDAEDITFDYEPSELGIDPRHAVKIDAIKQIRPLRDNQPWGIFYVQFESKRLPVVVLRRILRSLVPKSRQRDPNRPVWRMSDLLFISAQGEPGYRSISFAHFRQREGRVAELRTFSWDTRETHFYYIKNLNLEALRWPEDETDPDEWREQWRQAFTIEHRYTIRKSKELARQMARHAALVRDMVGQVYDLEADDGPLHQLYGNFKKALVHDLTPEAFADMVAQTVAYGLFSAATQTKDLSFDRVVDLIPSTNPFLKDLLAELTTEGAVDLEELGVGQLVEMLCQTDVDAILQDFGRQSGGGREDPIIHFYELFLEVYDKTKKIERAVFYTPRPIVSFIVRSVDDILRTRFGLADGLADTATWGEMDERSDSIDRPEGVPPATPFVQILDPAAGTGTFLEVVIEVVHETMTAKWKREDKSQEEIREAWNEYVAQNLLNRLYGLELMMAPYAVAHMKLGLKLTQTGYEFKSGERLRVFLSNTLEQPKDTASGYLLADFLASEAKAANQVKRGVPVSVVVGNPPYAQYSANLTEEAKTHIEKYRYANGTRITTRNPLQLERNLNDDYVKFLGWCTARIAGAPAVLGMVTNRMYLESESLVGVRQYFVEHFDGAAVIDLHGSMEEARRVESLAGDQNVFDITQGVAVSLFWKRKSDGSHLQRVRHGELIGSQDRKLSTLRSETWRGLVDQIVTPEAPDWWLNREQQETPERASALSEAFVEYSTLVGSNRDHLVIDFEKGPILERIEAFRDFQGTDEALCQAFGITLKKGWNLGAARRRLRALENPRDFIRQIDYRPFDRRPIFFHPDLIWQRAPVTSDNVLDCPFNLVLISLGRNRTGTVNGQWIARGLADKSVVSSRDNASGFPLYLYPEEGQVVEREWLIQREKEQIAASGDLTAKEVKQEWAKLRDQAERIYPQTSYARLPNLYVRFVSRFQKALNLRWIPEGQGDLTDSLGPEDLLYFAYAVLYSPSYRQRHAALLPTEFPYIPFTSRLSLFRALIVLGADLVALHLLEDDYRAASWNEMGKTSPLRNVVTTFVERETGRKMGKFSKRTCYQDGRVYLDTSNLKRSSYFEDVPDGVWNFHVGGYQVLHKWLYDRRETPSQPGRVLTNEDITHYQRIVVALKETMRLMEDIDEAIDAHGGWPIE